eukprot:4238971-Pyramimonas_sp.AAC.1
MPASDSELAYVPRGPNLYKRGLACGAEDHLPIVLVDRRSTFGQDVYNEDVKGYNEDVRTASL